MVCDRVTVDPEHTLRANKHRWRLTHAFQGCVPHTSVRNCWCDSWSTAVTNQTGQRHETSAVLLARIQEGVCLRFKTTLEHPTSEGQDAGWKEGLLGD